MVAKHLEVFAAPGTLRVMGYGVEGSLLALSPMGFTPDSAWGQNTWGF